MLRHTTQVLRVTASSLVLFLVVALSGCGYIRSPYLAGGSDFSIAVSPASSNLIAGAIAPPLTFTVTPAGGFNGVVSVALKLQPGFTCAPAPCTAVLPAYASPNILQLTSAAGTVPGTYLFDIVATSGTLSHTVRYALTLVTAPPVTTPDFSLAVSPLTVTTTAGSAAPPFSFTATPLNGFTGSITVASTPPAGFTCAPTACSVALVNNQAANALAFKPSATTAPGTYSLTFVASSGTLSHTTTASIVVLPPSAVPDFAFTVSPVTSSVVAGSTAPAYSFNATPSNSFTGNITVTLAPPAGFTCDPANCTVTLVNNQAANALTLTPAASVAAGTYTLNFFATSGTLSHTATSALLVTAATTPPPEMQQPCAEAVPLQPSSTTRQGFAYTGDPNPAGLVYDAERNRILAVNLQFNEIDLISPETMTVTGRLPVPQPMGIDLSADNKTLIIGTRTHYFYRATADTLCITDRHYLPLNPSPLIENVSPMVPTALADGSILIAASALGSSAGGTFFWTAADGFTQPAELGTVAFSASDVVVSGDRMHAFINNEITRGFVRYDVASGSFVTVDTGVQTITGVIAANQDGSRLLLSEECCGLVLTDANLNTIHSMKSGFTEDVIAEPDFSRFYLLSPPGYVAIVDDSLTPVGSFSASFADAVFSTRPLRAFDGKHRILALADSGIEILDTSEVGPVADINSVFPLITRQGDPYGAFQPPTPEAGLGTTLNGAYFPSVPSVTLSEGPESKLATDVSLVSQSKVQLTVPPFPNDCADVAAKFSVGVQAFAPLAFCYSPKVLEMDDDAGPTSGGSTLTLYGLGFGSTTPTVSIGGVASSNVTETYLYRDFQQFGLSVLKVLVPPGTAGDAAITISTSFGSITLPRAFHYVQRSDISLPSGASPFQLILDAARARILVTDSAHNQLLVYSLSSGAQLRAVATGTNPQGLALTPDGTRLILASGDYKVSVLDADTYALQQQVALPATAQNVDGTAPVGIPTSVAAMTGNKAYVITQSGYLSGFTNPHSDSYVFDYDLTANTLTPDPLNLTYLEARLPFYIASSSDGSTALVGELLSHAVGSATTPGDTLQGDGGDVALSSDGSTLSFDSQIFDRSFHWQNSTTANMQIQPAFGMSESYFYGAQFNASGSLYYRPGASHIRIHDAQHGNLLYSLAIPDGFTGSEGTQTTSPTRLLAVNPAGRQIIAATTAGISIFSFAADPLSIAQVKIEGGRLIVTGSGFSDSTAVKIDTTATATSFVSTMELDIAAPALASGAHSVTVTNTNGDTYTLTLAIVVP